MSIFFCITSTKKLITKVRMIIREAYFTERIDCWYCCTGNKRLTPKEESSSSLWYWLLVNTWGVISVEVQYLPVGSETAVRNLTVLR